MNHAHFPLAELVIGATFVGALIALYFALRLPRVRRYQSRPQPRRVARWLSILLVLILPLACAAPILPLIQSGQETQDHLVVIDDAGELPTVQLLEPGAVAWSTWLLSDATTLPISPPPADASPQTQTELAELRALLAQRDATTLEIVRRWDGPPTLLWNEITLDLLRPHWPPSPRDLRYTPVRSARLLSYVHVAMYDAVLATWQARYAYERSRPTDLDPTITPLTPQRPNPAYPSTHAAVAGAAAKMLTHFFPEDAAAIEELLTESVNAELWSGHNFPSDVEAGLDIGRYVAQLAIRRAEQDGAEEVAHASTPQGPQYWEPTPPGYLEPFDPTAGEWRPWVMSSGDQFRPPPPPPVDSRELQEDLARVRTIADTRTAAQEEAALYWDKEHPPVVWNRILNNILKEEGTNLVRTARAHALINIAMYDGMISCWDAKYTYWYPRPVTLDPELEVVLPTPPFPAYTSGHSTIAGAASEVLIYLFPDKRHRLETEAENASNSRIWGGIHFFVDIDVGLEFGRKLGRYVVEQVRGDDGEEA